jgi:hypothetical protein
MNSLSRKILAELGLNESVVGNAYLLQLLEQICDQPQSTSDNISQDASTLIEFIQAVRQFQRFDLITLCTAISAEQSDDDRVACELILLYLASEHWQEAYSFLLRRRTDEFPVSGSDLLKIVSKLLPDRGGSLEVWPNERLVYAEKTAILNVSMTVAVRQRSLIESLLKAVDRV